MGKYIKRSLMKKYVARAANALARSSVFREKIEAEKILEADRKLLGEKICLGAEFHEDDEFVYASIFAWQASHWSSVFYCMSPASFCVPLRKKTLSAN